MREGHCGSGSGVFTLRAPLATGQTSWGVRIRRNLGFAERPPASAPRLWTTHRPGVARAGTRVPSTGTTSRAIRVHRDIRRAQPVDKAVDHTRLIRPEGARGGRPMSETDLAEVWARSLEELATMQIEPHQRAWLKLTRPPRLAENTAPIATPNEFVKEQLETRLRALITHALSRELGRSIQLAVTVDPTAITAAPAFHPAPADPGPDGQAAGPDGHGGMPGTIGSPMSGRVPRAADPLDHSSSLGGAPPLGGTGLGGTMDPGSGPADGQLGQIGRAH